MMKVNNRQAIREVAWTAYKAEKKRNFTAIFAIGMASFLLAVMAALGASYWKTLTERQLRMQGIDYDIALSEPREEQVEIVRAMDKVKYAGLKVACMEVLQYGEQAIDGAEFYWLDEVCWEKQTVPALEEYEGHYPRRENEVMLSLPLLLAMHVTDYEIGMKLPFTYHLMAEGGGQQEGEFILSGWFKDYSGKEKGYVSKAFFDTSGVKQTDLELGSLTISLVNPLYFAKDIAKMNEAVGICGMQRIVADDYVVPQFCRTAAALAAMLLMVAASAYLFIFNTMYISAAKNIRYYGQLKTIGMTGVQLRGVVYRQAFLNAAAGIALGLTGAAAMANAAVPKLLQTVSGAYYEEKDIVSVGAWIYLAAGGFALLVNAISCRKPAKMVGDCSPAEAMRYTPGVSGVSPKKKRRRRQAPQPEMGSKKKYGQAPQPEMGFEKEYGQAPQPEMGSKKKYGQTSQPEKGFKNRSGRMLLPAMACQNMFRDKKQAAVIFLSSVLALSVFFTANVVILANDAKHILNELGRYDIRFINQTMMKEKKKQVFTEEKMEELKALDGVKAVRRVSSTQAEIPCQLDVYGEVYRAFYASRYSPGNYEDDMENYKNDVPGGSWRHLFGARLIGIDVEGFARINASLGNVLDAQAFENGRIAVTTQPVYVSGDFAMAGKTARFLLPEGRTPDTEYSIQIAAVGTVGDAPEYFGGGYTPNLIVSESYLKKLVGEAYVELIEVDYEKPYAQETEKAVKAVFAGEKKVTSDAKLDSYQSMEQSETQMKALGYTIAGIMAVLALFNYINMMAAGIHNRTGEFATLESIGMTARQIRGVLRMEGIGYGIISVAASLLVGVPFSYAVFLGMSRYQSLPYAVPWTDSLRLYAAAIALCTAVPVVIYRRTQGAGVMERLQKGEE